MTYRTALSRALVAVVAAALVTGCGMLGGDDDSGTETAANGTQVDTGDDEGSRGAVDVDLSDRHQNGSLLEVSRIEVRDRSVAVTMSLVNGYTEDVSLNQWGLWLVDDQGNPYAFDEPNQNSALTIGAGEELSGTLVFLGVVPDDATSVTLKSNVNNADDRIDVSDRNRNANNPEFLLEGIQLP